MENFLPPMFVCADITNQSLFFSAESPSQHSAISSHFQSKELKSILAICLKALLSMKCKYLKKSENVSYQSMTPNV